MISFLKICIGLCFDQYNSYIYTIEDFFQMYILFMALINSRLVLVNLSKCERPTWRQILLKISRKNFVSWINDDPVMILYLSF